VPGLRGYYGWTVAIGERVTKMPEWTALWRVLPLAIALAGCTEGAHSRLSSPSAPHTVAAPAAATPISASPPAQDPVIPSIGMVESRSGGSLAVQDGNGGGLITLIVEPGTIIDGATSGPDYARLQDHDLQRLKAGQIISGPARCRPDGSLVAGTITIRPWPVHGAEVVATGPNFLDVHLLRDRLSSTFAPETTRLMIASQAVYLPVGSPIVLPHFKPGQFVTVAGAEADDGSLVVFDFLLGKGNAVPPASPAPPADARPPNVFALGCPSDRQPSERAASSGTSAPGFAPSASAQPAPPGGATLTIGPFADAGWGNTTIDGGGAVVIARSEVSPPSFLRLGTSPDQLPHRYGFYEPSETSAAQSLATRFDGPATPRRAAGCCSSAAQPTISLAPEGRRQTSPAPRQAPASPWRAPPSTLALHFSSTAASALPKPTPAPRRG